MTVIRALWSLRRPIIVVCTLLVLLPLVVMGGEGKEMSCAYVIISMAVFWLSEALPISVTGFLPLFMFPLLGIMSAPDVARAFFKDIVVMFVGSMMIAVVIEKWNIHRRMALRILLTLGSQPIWLMLGLMLTSWFLSMWISNAATTALLLPIALAVVEELKRIEDPDETAPAGAVSPGSSLFTASTNIHSAEMVNNEESLVFTNDETTTKDRDVTVTYETEDNEYTEEEFENTGSPMASNDSDVKQGTSIRWKRLSKAFCLCIAYSANVGGTGSPTGRTSNFVLRGQLDIVYGKLGQESPVTFANWLLFAVPTSLVIVLCTWVWLQLFFLRCSGFANCFPNVRNKEASRMKDVLRKQYKSLGKLSFGQVAVLVHYAVLVILWITRDLGGEYGWSNHFKDGFIKDVVPAILVGTSLFIFPSKWPSFNAQHAEDQNNSKDKLIEPLMTWNYFADKMPWGVVFLVGGGLAMAKGAEVTFTGDLVDYKGIIYTALFYPVNIPTKFQVSGLSAWVGSQLTPMGSLDPWVLNMCLCFIVSIATEVTSNTATTALMLPIVADLALNVDVEPVYLMMPTTMSTAFAFMLPVATPSNAIVFSTGHITVMDMAGGCLMQGESHTVKAGCFLNVICVLVLVGSNETLGRLIYLSPYQTNNNTQSLT